MLDEQIRWCKTKIFLDDEYRWISSRVLLAIAVRSVKCVQCKRPPPHDTE